MQSENPVWSSGSELSCPAHQKFRCGVCYPGRFVTPHFVVSSTPPDSDPYPRKALRLICGNGVEVYVPSSDLGLLAKLLALICPQ